MYTHYAIRLLDHSGVPMRDSGMYITSAAYETPELARELGRVWLDAQRNSMLRKQSWGAALCRIETADDRRGGRRLVKETVLEIIERF